MVNGPDLDLPDFDILDDLSPEVVEVGPEGFPGLPAIRPEGGPELPFEK